MKLKDYLDFMRKELDLFIVDIENDKKNKCYYINYMINVCLWTEIIYKKDLKDAKKMEKHKKELIEIVKPYR